MMEGLLVGILSITSLFVVFLIAKEIVKGKFCVICASVALTWILLLYLYYTKSFADKTLLAILIGHSSLASYYLFEKKAGEKEKIFLLPVLLTLIFISYTLIEGLIKPAILPILIVWLVFAIIWAFQSDGRIGEIARKLVECCKNA